MAQPRRLCRHCTLTFGAHRSGSDTCPGHEGRMDWSDTAINWIGDGLVKAVLPLVNTDEEVEVVRVDRFEARCWCGWSQLHNTVENATKDAAEHDRAWHGREGPMRFDSGWSCSEVKPMTVNDLREALKDQPDDMPVMYDGGNEAWRIDQWGIYEDGFNLFCQDAPDIPRVEGLIVETFTLRTGGQSTEQKGISEP